MNCPVCDRNLAPTLSICPACGAMMNDTVREELQSKITTCSAPRMEARSVPVPASKPFKTPPPAMPSPVARRIETADLVAPKTSQTLVEFQTKSASLPDWRLQLQNAVQQRKGGHSASAVSTSNAQSFPTNGGAALKAEIVPQAAPEPVANISDPRVANAMQRIANSRKAFASPEPVAKKPMPAKPVPMRSFPFDVVSSNGHAATAAAPARIAMPVTAPPKPRLVVPEPVVAEKRETNKLPPLVEPIEQVVEIKEPTPTAIKVDSGALPTEFGEIKRIRIRAEHAEIEIADETDNYEDEIDDLAPFSMRFGAGLFDLIIGGFVAALLLSPFAFSGANWTTTFGILTFLAATAIVSFLYMTICVGFFGKTMGMRLFSLELVDAMENEYPTLQQAAISSSIYLISMALAGTGFITALFNEERRAAHDLLSGTIVVREF